MSLADPPWLYPAVSIAHIVGFVTLVGSAAIFDLRVLGLVKSIPVRALSRLTLPWSWAALVVIIPTGVAMYSARPDDFLTSRIFQLKMALLLAAGINTAMFLTGPWQTVAAWNVDVDAPLAARASAALSIALWLAIIGCGRMLAPF